MIYKFASGVKEKLSFFEMLKLHLPVAEFIPEAISVKNDYKSHYKSRLATYPVFKDLNITEVGTTEPLLALANRKLKQAGRQHLTKTFQFSL